MIIEDVRDNTDDGSEVVIGKTVEGNKDLGPVKSGTIGTMDTMAQRVGVVRSEGVYGRNFTNTGDELQN